ncbi:PqqD family protein [Kitasatospora aureofaciens]
MTPRLRLRTEHQPSSRPDGDLQIGSLPGIASILPDPEGWRRTLLQLLDGTLTTDQIIATLATEHPGAPAAAVRNLLTDLARHGHLQPRRRERFWAGPACTAARRASADACARSRRGWGLVRCPRRRPVGARPRRRGSRGGSQQRGASVALRRARPSRACRPPRRADPAAARPRPARPGQDRSPRTRPEHRSPSSGARCRA